MSVGKPPRWIRGDSGNENRQSSSLQEIEPTSFCVVGWLLMEKWLRKRHTAWRFERKKSAGGAGPVGNAPFDCREVWNASTPTSHVHKRHEAEGRKDERNTRLDVDERRHS
jgi:hypothetical protein